MKLKIKMPLMFISFLIINVLVLFLVTNKFVVDGITNTAVRGFNSTAYTFSRMLNNWIYEQGVTINSLVSYNDTFYSYLMDPSELNRADATHDLIEVESRDIIYSTALTDANGRVILEAGNRKIDVNRNFKSHNAWNTQHSSLDNVYISTEIEKSFDDKIYVLPIIFSLKDSNGNHIGNFIMNVNWNKFIKDELSFDFGNSARLVVFNDDGLIIGHQNLDAMFLPTFSGKDTSASNANISFKSDVSGGDVFVSYYEIPITGWNASIAIDSEELYADATTTRTIIAIVSVLMVIIGSIIIVFMSRSVSNNIIIFRTLITHISGGDFTVIPSENILKSKDEWGDIGRALKQHLENTSSILSKVNETIKLVSDSSKGLTGDTEMLSGRTESQAANLEETASSMEEMASAIKQSTENAVSGNNMMKESTKSVNSASLIITSTTENIEEVHEASVKISDITKIIENIAFQTNILALNAAVEAARAGEQGKGFAVVASEVRNLAQTTQSSVKDISTLIADSNDKINKATTTAHESSDIFAQIRENIEKTSQIMEDISSFAVEQQAGIEQVNKAVMELDVATQENTSLVDKTSMTAEILFKKSSELYELMKHFKLPSTVKNIDEIKIEKNALEKNNKKNDIKLSTTTKSDNSKIINNKEQSAKSEKDQWTSDYDKGQLKVPASIKTANNKEQLSKSEEDQWTSDYDKGQLKRPDDMIKKYETKEEEVNPIENNNEASSSSNSSSSGEFGDVKNAYSKGGKVNSDGFHEF